jgi:hypothetical protein
VPFGASYQLRLLYVETRRSSPIEPTHLRCARWVTLPAAGSMLVLHSSLRTRINKTSAYFSPSWTAFQADRGRHFSVIVDGVSD